MATILFHEYTYIVCTLNKRVKIAVLRLTALTERAIFSLVIASLHFVAAILITFGLRKWRALPYHELLIIFWLVYDAIVHFTLEGPFVYFSLNSTVLETEGILADVWKEYSLADYRWGVSDPTIVSLEIITVIFDGLCCVILVYAILRDKPYRHFVQVVLCVCELYGGWMTFAPEWLTGSPNLATSNPLYLWIYLVFFNGLWVIIPLILLVHSYVAMSESFSQKKQKKK